MFHFFLNIGAYTKKVNNFLNIVTTRMNMKWTFISP